LEPQFGANRAAAEATVAALRRVGALKDTDSAKVAILLSLASVVDDKPHSPGLWMEYRGAEIEIRKGMADGSSDEAQALLDYLSGKMGDKENPLPPNSRRRGRPRGTVAGNAADGVATAGRGSRAGVTTGR
jgi:hypothetical protein